MRYVVYSLFAFGITLSLASGALAQVRPNISVGEPSVTELNARKLYQRLTGAKVPVDSPVIAQMVELLNKGDRLGAAKLATKDPNFLNITVKLMALEMSTRDETIKTPLNDFVAGFVGSTRDQKDARELLTGNFYYHGSGPNIRSNPVDDILAFNNHYADLERFRVNLAENLVRVEPQVIATSKTTTVPNPDPAGLLTSRAFIFAHALAGTNRRLVEYTFRQFMCVPLSEWADTGASDARIGRDIDRFPAGDHMTFLTSCKGCHTVMDGFRGAFAKWEFGGYTIQHSSISTSSTITDPAFQLSADPNGIVPKMNKNRNIFPSGHETVNDSFVNNATRPANAELFGWRGNTAGGNGVKDFGAMIANSRRFSQCMAKRVFKTVCRKELDPITSKEKLKAWGDEFEASGYRMQGLFESIAVKPECLGI